MKGIHGPSPPNWGLYVHETEDSGLKLLHTRTGVVWMTVVASGWMATGCGEPNLSQLKPTTWKPAAEVLLVDHPPNWQTKDIIASAAANGVACRVVRTTDQTVVPVLQRDLRNRSIGLLVVVSDAPIPPSLNDVAKSHLGVRFEWIGTQWTTTMPTLNVRQMAPQPLAVSYALGWLTGQLAAAGGVSVGWLTDGTSWLNRGQMRAALAGLNAGDATVNLVPFTSTVATGTGNATGSLVPFTSALPRLLMVGRPLTSIEWTQLRASSVTVISLCPQPFAYQVAGQPVVPDERAIGPDFQAYAHSHWQAGNVYTPQAPMVIVDPVQVPATLQVQLQNLQVGLQTAPLPADGGWSGVPVQVRQRWSPMLVTTG